MNVSRRWRWWMIFACLPALIAAPQSVSAADLSSEAVLKSIDRAKRFLIQNQNNNGSWTTRTDNRYRVGVSSLALLSLLNAGMTVDDPAVKRGLEYLRSVKEPEPDYVYEVSLMIMALAAAKDGGRDKARIAALAQKLEDAQIRRGDNAGSWSYRVSSELLDFGGDRSNGQFAVLGLREAVEAGIPVSRQTWERAHRHWVASQNADGGWGYSGLHNQNSTGSMTVAGISTLAITEAMLVDHQDFNSDGTPNCCSEYEPNEPLERGIRWLENRFAVGNNPGSQTWLLYYLYGLERAGRLTGRRFFGDHDWYREGAQFLVERQSQRLGSWQGRGGMETDPVVGTSLALLFLSKGLSPVLINKLKYGDEGDGPEGRIGANWNKHRNDVRNLSDLIAGLPKWPKLLTWQVVDMNKLRPERGAGELSQAPILYLAGKERPEFTPQQRTILQEYLNQGGFLFAVANCDSEEFDAGFRELMQQLFPGGEAELKPLPADHPIYRSEYLLDSDSVELWGADFGCRTAIVYSPDDISCFWDKWARQDPPQRTPEMKAMIAKATRVGVNVVAYATGREPPNKLEHDARLTDEGQQDQIERGFLQIAKLRHTGGWDSAPKALRNLLLALNQSVGMAASTKKRDLPASDPNIFKYPVVYMHGRNRFQLGEQERKQLREYLERGGVLFADACCGARPFDQSFRDLMDELFPDRKLHRIPANHEMFTSEIGHDIRRVKRRGPEADDPQAALNTVVREGEPFLEGIEIDGRYAVIYSKYDISCALERQASVACAGYVADDALKIAINVILYALLQDVSFLEDVENRAGQISE